MADAYGSHLIRLIFNLLGGRAVQSQVTIRSKSSRQYTSEHEILKNVSEVLSEKRQVPAAFTAKLKETVGEIVQQLSDTEIRSFATHAAASPVLQALLLLHASDKQTADMLIDKILMDLSGMNVTVFFN